MVHPRAMSRASGCKINTSANLSVLGGRNFQYIPPLVSVILHYQGGDNRGDYQLIMIIIVATKITNIKNHIQTVDHLEEVCQSLILVGYSGM